MLKLLMLAVLLRTCFAPPVTKNKSDETHETQTDGLEDYIEYHRYIREVVNALESDPTFREKLEKANEDDIRSGKIAHELELVSHHVRTRLDEIKRTELERLRDLTRRKLELTGENDLNDPLHHHVDHDNPHTFEIEDLKKLITRTTQDLAEADKKRRDEFKEYEMQKEFERQDKLNHTNGDERAKLEKEYQEMEQKHKKHEKLHTPGHKQQIEEVWEEQDHMQQDFNPKTFFMLHDLDSNGLWDQDEVKALFVKELDKMYAEGHPEDDMRERVEEMERMRESVFKEMDANNDGFIDYNEFLAQTKKNDYEKDNGWQGIDEQRPYTDEEMDAYIRHHQNYPQGYHPNDINAQMHPQAGYHPQQGYNNYPQAGGYMPQGQQPPQGYHPQQGQGYYPQQGQAQPQGYPQGHAQPQGYPQGHAPPQGYPQGHAQPQGYPQGHAPPQGYPQGHAPPQGYPSQGHAPPQGYNPQQGHPQGNAQPQGYNPQQGHAQPKPQGQVPPQTQFHPGQLPQAQIQPQHIPNDHDNQPNLNTNEIVPPKGKEPVVNKDAALKVEPQVKSQEPEQQVNNNQVNQAASGAPKV